MCVAGCPTDAWQAHHLPETLNHPQKARSYQSQKSVCCTIAIQELLNFHAGNRHVWCPIPVHYLKSAIFGKPKSCDGIPSRQFPPELMRAPATDKEGPVAGVQLALLFIGFHWIRNFFRTSQVQQKYRFRWGLFCWFLGLKIGIENFLRNLYFFTCIFYRCRVDSKSIDHRG